MYMKYLHQQSIAPGLGARSCSWAIMLAVGYTCCYGQALPQNMLPATAAVTLDGANVQLPEFFHHDASLYPQVLQEIFATCGYSLANEGAMTRLEPQYRLEFGAGGELLATGDPVRMAAEIAAISPDDATRFRAFLERNRNKLAQLAPFFQRSFESWRDLLAPDVLKSLSLLSPWRSLDDDLRP